MRRVVTFVLAAGLLSGCASTWVGTIDQFEPLEPVRDRGLPIVPRATSFGGEAKGPAAAFGWGGADTLRLAEFVSRDSLGGPSYARYAEEAVAEVVREAVLDGGNWTAVTVGPLSDGLAVSEQPSSCGRGARGAAARGRAASRSRRPQRVRPTCSAPASITSCSSRTPAWSSRRARRPSRFP